MSIKSIQMYDRPADVPPLFAAACAEMEATGPEVRDYFESMAAGDFTLVPEDLRVAIAVADDHQTPVGWAAIHGWHAMLQLQASDDREGGMRGPGTALCAALLCRLSTRDRAMATFDKRCFDVAILLGFTDARLYRQIPNGWINVGYRYLWKLPDEAGVHAAAPAVCSVPLATGEKGALA